MSHRILLVVIATETDIVLARQRTRRLAELIGFEAQDQVRITTAVSEIARNAFEHGGGGQIEFRVSGTTRPQLFEIAVRDKGRGIAELNAVLSGLHVSRAGMGVGLLGARRLMDRFDIESSAAGTMVRMGKFLPPRAPIVTAAVLKQVSETMAADGPANAMEEIRQQNRQILVQLDELRERRDDLERLNHELQDTNRGVVALYAELDERADHLRRADELKSKFLSHMSHEFRTPLNSILALSRLLLGRTDGELTAEQEKQVMFIRKAAGNLTELVDDLLDLAKVEAGKIVIAPARFSASALFGTLRGMLRPLLVGNSVDLVFDEPEDMPDLETDEGKLSQILRNFISNALKFTEAGEVRVSAMASPDDDTVTFCVRDTGIGIAAEDIELIFQEFGQVAHRLQGRVKGTGLGLPLSRKLAELMGGTIAVESTPGEGSAFMVTLPRCYQSPWEPGATEVSWTIQAGKIPVLVVEDDPADAFAVERILAGSPYQMMHAHSIQEAQRALNQFRPAAIVLDVVLEGEESWRLMMQLRQSEEYATIPMLVLSSTGDMQKALNLGADEYVTKPIEAETLRSLLDRLTGQRSVVDVLLVDDEEITRYLVRQLLPRTKYHIREAEDGAEALRLLREGARPDVVLLDVNMPEMDGFGLLEQMAATPELADIPAVVLTSAILTPADRQLLGRAVAILSKSDLAAETLSEEIDRASGKTGPPDDQGRAG